MSENLGNFLVDLACDPDLAARFRENPHAELARTGLTPEEQAAIMARDSRRLATALGASPENSGGGITKKTGGKKRPAPKKGPRKSSGSKKKR